MELDLNRPGELMTPVHVMRRRGAMRPARDGIIVGRHGVTALAPDPPRYERAAFVIDLVPRHRSPDDAVHELACRVFACRRNNRPVPRDVDP